MAFNSLIQAAISTLEKYNEIVAKKFSLDPSELQTELDNFLARKPSSSSSSSETKSSSPAPKKEVKKAAPKKRSTSKSDKLCNYKIARGKNTGKKCDSKVCSDSDKYCRKHLPKDQKEKIKEKKSADKGDKKKKSAEKKKAKVESESEQEEEKETKWTGVPVGKGRERILHKDGVPTKYVVDNNATVIGVMSDDGTVKRLSEEDVKFCKKITLNFIAEKNPKKKVEEDEDDNDTVATEKSDTEADLDSDCDTHTIATRDTVRDDTDLEAEEED